MTEPLSTPLPLLGWMKDNNLLAIACGSVIYWVCLVYYRGETRKLRHIPTIGPTVPVLSYIGVIGFFFYAPRVIQSGMEKFPNTMFKVADIFRWFVVVHDPKLIEEIRKLPDNIASPKEAISEGIQMKYTLGDHIVTNPYHIPVIAAKLTRALPELVPEVYEEVVDSFNELISPTEDWISVRALDTMKKVVARASNRVFVGYPLCRDPDYVDLNVQYTVDVIKASTTLRMAPRVLRPLIHPIVSNVPYGIRRGLKHLSPLIAARRKAREESGQEYPPDMLSWLMQVAVNEEQSDWYLTSRVLMVNFAAIHSSSMAFTHVLYDLVTYPEYTQRLRDEVEQAVKQHGWSKAALDETPRVDSFIKESQRLNPLAVFLLNRVLMKDHVFSDGTMVPQGTTIGVATTATHLNPETYEDPLRFDGFRFIKLKAQNPNHLFNGSLSQANSSKFDVSAANVDSLGFGLGRHACPGRVFAANELKIMLAHVVTTYDVKLAEGDEGKRPDNMWLSTACVPNPTAQILFRKRAVI